MKNDGAPGLVLMVTYFLWEFWVLSTSSLLVRAWTGMSNATENGVCNFTSRGDEIMGNGGHPITLRSMAVPQTLFNRTFYCFYTFKPATQRRILLSVLQLSVGRFNYTSSSCDHGYVRLWDGIRQPGLYRYPPNTLCGIFTSRPEVMKFSSDYALEVELYHPHADPRISLTFTYKYVDFDLELDQFPYQVTHDMKTSASSVSVCHWEIVWESCDSECTLLSPGYPGIYPPNVVCQYHITSHDVNIAYQLSFSGYNHRGKIREFNIRESKSACDREFIEVYDGPSSWFPLIGRFCNHNNVPDITSTGKDLLLIFTSGPDVPPYDHRGFHASVQGITKEWDESGLRVDGSFCDWAYNSSQGSVSSPDHWIPKDTVCRYTIYVTPGHLLHLILTVYGLRPSCSDFIDIYEDDILKVRICRNTLIARKILAESRAKSKGKGEGDIEEDPNTFTYHLHGPMVLVQYSVDERQLGPQPDSGFWMSFKQVLVPTQKPEPALHDIQSDEASPMKGGPSPHGLLISGAMPLQMLPMLCGSLLPLGLFSLGLNTL